MTFKHIAAAFVAMFMLTTTEANANDIEAAIKQNPGRSPEWLAEQTGASVDEVIDTLVAKYRIPVSPDKFDEVWAKLMEWENPLIITIVSGNVIEIESRIPEGEYHSGFFNLKAGYALHGHYQVESFEVIYVIEEPSREGGVARQVAFFDKDGHRVFGVFVNRHESGGQHDEATLAQFKKMQEHYRQALQ